MTGIEQLGWTAALAARFEQLELGDCQPARVSAEHRGQYRIMDGAEESTAHIAGRLRYLAASREDLPAVGDWVAVNRQPEPGAEAEAAAQAVIHAILPRQTALIRREPDGRKRVDGLVGAQVLAANLDTVFLVSALNQDYNLRRIERTLTLIWESGAQPVVVLNKADLCATVEERLAETMAVAIGAPVVAVSALTGTGMEQLAPHVEPGRTIALIGSSGAGKSTLINWLAGGEVMVVREIREHDSRGRHTTTHRQLIMLPTGGLLIDTPGMREIGLWESEEGLQSTFPDIEALAAECRFRDCQHRNEPRCAVRAALDAGTLDGERYKSYVKLQREIAFVARQQDRQARVAEQRRWKMITKESRRRNAGR